MVEEQTYKNAAVGFEITFPNDFQILEQETIQEMMSEGKDAVKDSFSNQKDLDKAVTPVCVAEKIMDFFLV